MPKVNNVQPVGQNATTAINVVISAKFANLRRNKKGVMTLQKDQPDGVTSECPSYDRVFLGTLEAEQSVPLNSRPSTPTTAGIEHRKKKNPHQSHDQDPGHSESF